jgi:preprotein translocase subunit SecG
MTLIISVIHVMVCIALVGVVLLQKGSTGMGAAFGGSSQSVFGAQGSAGFLGKLTTILAVIFMTTSMTLAFFSNQEKPTSIMEGIAGQAARQEAPIAPVADPDAPPEVPKTATPPQESTTLGGGESPLPIPTTATKEPPGTGTASPAEERPLPVPVTDTDTPATTAPEVPKMPATQTEPPAPTTETVAPFSTAPANDVVETPVSVPATTGTPPEVPK